MTRAHLSYGAAAGALHRRLHDASTHARFLKSGLPVPPASHPFDETPQRALALWNSAISDHWRLHDEAAACRAFAAMPHRTPVTWTAMVTGYARAGRPHVARAYFDAMPERTIASWNAMISGYSQNGLPRPALELFLRMLRSGSRPDDTTWSTVLAACSATGDLNLADSLAASMQKRPIHPNHFVLTAMLDMYAKCGDLRRSRRIFDSMRDRTAVSWNAMISAYARAGEIDPARDLFRRMPGRDVITWNSMISGLVQNARWLEAVELFEDMVAAGEVEPDEVTVLSVASACGHLGALEAGERVARFARERALRLGLSARNALVFMYSRCGSMEKARKVFDEMPRRNVFSYNSLVTGLAIHGLAAEAIGLLRSMEDEGIQPDRITYIGILTACSHSGALAEARHVFAGVGERSVDHYACMVDLLGRAGRLDEAKRLIDEMPMVPHAGIYGALLNASRVHRRVDLGEFAARELFELEPQNSGNYVLLANIYANAGRWDDAEKVRSAMRRRDVRKTSGSSWVEVDGRVVRFVAGDRWQSWADEIYQSLEVMVGKMKAIGYAPDRNCVLQDVEEEEKEEMVGVHSEKLAVAFAIQRGGRSVIRISKNLRICEDCHRFMKIASRLEGREILVRDNSRFHSFKEGECSCRDYW